MIHLPTAPRRCDLRGFVVALSLVGGIALCGLAALFGVSAAVALMTAASAAAIVLLAGLFIPSGARRLFDRWSRLSRSFGRSAGWWVTRIAFFVVSASGRAGSQLPVSRPSAGSTGWVSRETESDAPFSSQSMRPRNDSESRGWLGPLLGWAGPSGNWWMWALAPYLALLSALRPASRSTLTHSNYTLY